MWFVLVPFRQKHIEVILGSGLKGVFDTMIYLCLPREGYVTLILCNFCIFDVKNTTEISYDGFSTKI